MSTMPDGDCTSASAYALGALAPEEERAFEAHLPGCASCAESVVRDADVLSALSARAAAPQPAARLRTQILDLAEAPRLPVDLTTYEWQEVRPGLKIAEVKRDDARGLRACLVWGHPGAVNPTHGHEADEVLLVLQGALRDFRGTYTTGHICRSEAGLVHTEEVVGEADCICYALYYDRPSIPRR
jgi:anti-sigma factor ChrR (cupin superfamily)